MKLRIDDLFSVEGSDYATVVFVSSFGNIDDTAVIPADRFGPDVFVGQLFELKAVVN